MTTKRLVLRSLLVIALVVVAVQVSPVRADLCYGFPLNQCANSANTAVIETFDVSVKMVGFGGIIKTKTAPGGPYTYTAPACTSGTTVAANAAAALCEAVIASGVSCFTALGTGGTGTCGAHVTPIAAGGCLAAFATANVDNVVCDMGAPAGDEFNIRHQGIVNFSVLPCGSNKVDKFELSRNQGGTTNADLLDAVLIRVDPDGAPGNVTFNAVGAPGPGPSTFTVNTNLGDTGFNGAVCNGFQAMGLVASLHTAAEVGRFLDAPSAGSFVEVRTPASVTEVGVNPATQGPNVSIQMETVAAGAGIPTLNEWGMGILIAVLLVTGIWMLRRRQRLQQV